MSRSMVVANCRGERSVADLGCPLPLDRLVSGAGPWEVEIGFGKGRYLLRRAKAEPETRFLGIEMASKYFRVLAQRARRQGVGNLVAVRGEALAVISCALPRRLARVLHVYFPDPWPKARHHRRRLFEPASVDLLIALLEPAGRLCFATDFLAYGAVVEELLRSYPGLEVQRREEPWPDGPRTNYEAKYQQERRPILRLEAARLTEEAPLHPRGRREVLAGYAPPAGGAEAISGSGGTS